MKHTWPMIVAAELIKRIHKGGGRIPINDQRLARELAEFLREQFDDWEPSNTELRNRIRQLLGPARNSG